MKHIPLIFFILLIISLFGLLTGCFDNQNYKVGNRITLDYEVETKLSFKIIRKYIDSLIDKEYKVPAKWIKFDKLVDIDSLNSKRIYFKNSPEEMYLVQFNGVLLIADVLNESIVRNDWISTRERVSQSELERIQKRFELEILNKIERWAKSDNIPDSVLYYKPILQ